ncbi:MAG TPA: hypothetical protein VJQ56_01930, partial [Blastocatellia bacterium]|nr:hypothetical protein [Blastocatellia bacterium]
MRFKRTGLVFAVAALIIASGGGRAALTDSGLSAERISGHVAFLASEKLQGRRAGTPGADEAARYIADQFRGYGLKPASGSGYLQPFTFVAGVRLGREN